MPLTPAELAQLHKLATRSPRRRLGLGARLRRGLAGLASLLAAAWWGARGSRVKASTLRRVARRQLRSARDGRG